MNMNHPAILFPTQYKEFVEAYKEAALWSSTDDDGLALYHDKYADYTWSKDAKKRIDDDCMKFFNMAYPIIYVNVSLAGRDFWLTRNGHGAGFWEGEWAYPSLDFDIENCGDFLTAAAKKYGELYVYPYAYGLFNIE